jgi:hypothetical protein
MDTYIKMCHAHEEIQCLNIEIRQLVTYLHDKTQYLVGCEKQLGSLHAGLTHQVSLHHKICARFTRQHHHCILDISLLEGFSGCILPGESLEQGPEASTSSPTVCCPAQLVPDGIGMAQGAKDDTLEDLEDEENTEEDSEEGAHSLYAGCRTSYIVLYMQYYLYKKIWLESVSTSLR